MRKIQSVIGNPPDGTNSYKIYFHTGRKGRPTMIAPAEPLNGLAGLWSAGDEPAWDDILAQYGEGKVVIEWYECGKNDKGYFEGDVKGEEECSLEGDTIEEPIEQDSTLGAARIIRAMGAREEAIATRERDLHSRLLLILDRQDKEIENLRSQMGEMAQEMDTLREGGPIEQAIIALLGGPGGEAILKSGLGWVQGKMGDIKGNKK